MRKPIDSTQRLLQFLLLNVQACVLPAAAYNRLNIYIDNCPCHSLHLAFVSRLICPRAPVLAPALQMAGDTPSDVACSSCHMPTGRAMPIVLFCRRFNFHALSGQCCPVSSAASPPPAHSERGVGLSRMLTAGSGHLTQACWSRRTGASPSPQMCRPWAQSLLHAPLPSPLRATMGL